jgi:predicted DNA-binding protein
MTKSTHLRLPEELRDRLDAFATRTRRTLNAAAELLLTNALDDEELQYEQQFKGKSR